MECGAAGPYKSFPHSSGHHEIALVAVARDGRRAQCLASCALIVITSSALCDA